MDTIPIFLAVILFAAFMLTRVIYKNIPSPADAVVDLGMERWHQQDLAAWDDEFEREIGYRPFVTKESQLYKDAIAKGLQGSFNQLLQPGLQNSFQQQQAPNAQQQQLGVLGMSLGGLMAQQAQQGLFNLQQAQAQQQQALAAHEAFCEAARLGWLRDRGDIN